MPSTSFHDTWPRRALTLASISLFRRLCPRSGRVLFLPGGICIKYGGSIHLSEAAAMRLVATSTSIPVPTLLCAFERKGTTYLVMRRIKGDHISTNWHQRSEASRAALLAQLRGYLRDLRHLPHPRPGWVAAADLTTLHDVRVEPDRAGFGPFPNSSAFHRFLRDGIADATGHLPDVQRLMALQGEKDYATCMTHGDLSSINILVRNDRIVGIIDWEMAGWYPVYWEFTNAQYGHPYDLLWAKEMDRVLSAFPRELEMEQLRRKYFGAI
ncbi:MAG: hypothetical protein M1826_003575 [Phylliscum demangeonii]|nr:MAG: hypothetical protein M1826_003575 [Phylliscum demangeonii]